jgi:hypothetical protein
VRFAREENKAFYQREEAAFAAAGGEAAETENKLQKRICAK